MSALIPPESNAHELLLRKLVHFDLGSKTHIKFTIKALEFILSTEVSELLDYNDEIRCSDENILSPYRKFYKKNISHFDDISSLFDHRSHIYLFPIKYENKEVERVKDCMGVIIRSFVVQLKSLSRKEINAIKILEGRHGSLTHLFLTKNQPMTFSTDKTSSPCSSDDKKDSNFDTPIKSRFSLTPCQLGSIIVNVFVIGVFTTGVFITKNL